MYLKPITSEFFTTINFSSYRKTLKLLTLGLPGIRNWEHIKQFETEILEYLKIPESKILSLYNWRSALFQALKTIWVSNKSEVIVSGYTCVSVSNAIIQSKAKVVYCDISKVNLWLDTKALEKSITKNTKAIVVQHTFWRASNIATIMKIANKNNIAVIEDCAHSLWSKIWEKHLWTFWDISIFSTSRDKVISSISWGFLIINNKKYNRKFNEVKKKIKKPSRTLTIRTLLYNIIWYEAFLTFNFLKIWKILMFISRKLWLITNIITKTEKNCNYSNFYLSMPNSLAFLWQKELEILDFTQNHRSSIAEYYNTSIKNPEIVPLFKELKSQTINYFRFPILVKNTETKDRLYKYMKKNWVLLWDSWSWTNIVPIWSNINNAWYTKGNCSVSEDISSRILLLPNHYLITVKDTENIIELLNNFE